MFRNAGTILAVLAATIALDGCSTSGIKEDRARKVADLSTIYVHVEPEAPQEKDLAAAFGTPAAYRAGDLTLQMYSLEYAQAREVQKASRKAARRAQKEALKDKDKEKDKESMDALDAAVLVLFAPIWVPSMLLAVPLAGADYAVGSAIVAAEGNDPREGVTGMGALVVRDAEGNYRWQACCFSKNVRDEQGPVPRMMPDPPRDATSTTILPVPDIYRTDLWVLVCSRARNGDGLSQTTLFESANKSVPDPVYTYFWARTRRDGNPDGEARYLDWVEKSFSREDLAAGEAYYESHPLGEVDCRALAEMLIEAEVSGSKGPNASS